MFVYIFKIFQACFAGFKIYWRSEEFRRIPWRWRCNDRRRWQSNYW